MISIIIPVYKTEPYLRKSLDSVCGQTYQDLEIIIVNDGSPDQSGAILNEYKQQDKRIRVIDQKNSGLSSARNAALDVAHGEYVLFLDSDDWMDTDVCEKAVAAAAAEKADVVMWSYYREFRTSSRITYVFGTQPRVFHFGETDYPYRRIVGPIGKELQAPQNLDRAVTAWGKLYRREVIGDTRFVDTKIIGTEDCLFAVEVFSRTNTVVYLPDAMNHYRKDNETSLTHGYDPKLVDKWQENYRRIHEHIRKNHEPDEFFQALTHRVCLSLIGLSFRLNSDSQLSRQEKIQELKRLLSLDYYHNALLKMDTQFLQPHWKLFYFNARHGRARTLMLMVWAMMRLRKMSIQN